jgi:hypothetical protein
LRRSWVSSANWELRWVTPPISYLDAFVGGGGVNEPGESFGNNQECQGGEGAPLGDPTVDREGGTVSPVDFDPPARGLGGIGEEGG